MENKLNSMIQLMNIKIEELSSQRNNCGNIVFVCEHMLKIQKYIIVIGSLICLICNGFIDISNFVVSALVNGISGVLGISIAVATMMLYFGIAKMVFSKKYKKLETEISVTEDLKREYELELRKLKEQKKDNVVSSENTIYVESYHKELTEIVNNRISEVIKPKKRTLKKK